MHIGNLIAIALIFCTAFSGRSSADEVYGFVQITCAPELGYFSIHRFQIYNLAHGGPYLTDGSRPTAQTAQDTQRKYGIFRSRDLKEIPFECTIPRFKLIDEPGEMAGFSVKVIGHLDENSDETSYSRISDDAEVFLNGKSIALMGLNPHGFVVGTSSLAMTLPPSFIQS